MRLHRRSIVLLLVSLAAWLSGPLGVLAQDAGSAQAPQATGQPLTAQDEFDAIYGRIVELYQSGSYAEALPVVDEALSKLAAGNGTDSVGYATLLSVKAQFHVALSDFGPADQLLKNALELARAAVGDNDAAFVSILNKLAGSYQQQGRFAESRPLYEQCLQFYEATPGVSPATLAIALNNMGESERTLGLYKEAEAHFDRAIALAKEALGEQHPEYATLVNNKANLSVAQGRNAEAEPLFKESLAIREAALGSDHPDVATALNNLAELYRALGRYQDAEPLTEKALRIAEASLGSAHPMVGTFYSNLGRIYHLEGRNADAEQEFLKSLEIRKAALGEDNFDVAATLGSLAEVYRQAGRFGEAEPLMKESLAMAERALGPDHPEVGTLLNNLANLFHETGRMAEAEQLLKRSLDLRQRALGPDHPDVGQSLNNLALLYQHMGRNDEAVALLQRFVALMEKALGPEHPDLATGLGNLAELYRLKGATDDAEANYLRAGAICEKVYGPVSEGLALVENNLGLLDYGRDRYADAEGHVRRALEIMAKAAVPDHPTLSTMWSNLAEIHTAMGQLPAAVEDLKQSTQILERRVLRAAAASSRSVSSDSPSEIALEDNRFWRLLKVANRMTGDQGTMGGRLAADMFETAQWAMASEAGRALAQMASRAANGNPEIAVRVRDRQDLTGEWQRLDQGLSVAMARPPQVRDRAAEASTRARLKAIDQRLTEIDRAIAADFPEFAALASPAPLPVEAVQSALGADEALILLYDTPALAPFPEETFVWAITKTETRWVRSDLGRDALASQVAALRCGLDASAWSGEGRSRCAALLGRDTATAWLRGQPLPFDVAAAHALYAGLFQDIAALIEGKSLLIVTSGALNRLPLQVLVTEAPDPAASPANGMSNVAWLVRRHALSVLPTVASLTALRRQARASAAPLPFIGFGDPVLEGSPRCTPAAPASGCPGDESEAMAAVQTDSIRADDPLESEDSYFRSGLGAVDKLKRLCPLPDTAQELACVARSLAAGPSDVVLRESMTESSVKSLPLARYRVVQFATHGLLAGETARFAAGRAEPALVMTPPDTASEVDDGLLTASEIAALKLDADWVVMSACNTAAPAAGGDAGTGALSGLARAFFYAGARALLVSHWPVNSSAATLLTTHAFRELAVDQGVGRAEALRRAALTVMNDPKRPKASHPSYWAPFVLVGEGGAGR